MILDDNIIDITSFKYRYHDVNEYKFKEGKIYNPYKHFREIGMSFKTSRNGYEKIFKAKLDLKNDKIIYTMDFDRKLFDFDSFYISKNQFFILDPTTRKIIGSYAFYHKAINYYYQAFQRKVPSADQFFREYYNLFMLLIKTFADPLLNLFYKYLIIMQLEIK